MKILKDRWISDGLRTAELTHTKNVAQINVNIKEEESC